MDHPPPMEKPRPTLRMNHRPPPADHERLAPIQEIRDNLGKRIRPFGADQVSGVL